MADPSVSWRISAPGNAASDSCAVPAASLQSPDSAARLPPHGGIRAEPFPPDVEPACHFIGSFDVIDLHLDHADAQFDPRIDVLQCIEVLVGAAGQLQHEVVDAQT